MANKNLGRRLMANRHKGAVGCDMRCFARHRIAQVNTHQHLWIAPAHKAINGLVP